MKIPVPLVLSTTVKKNKENMAINKRIKKSKNGAKPGRKIILVFFLIYFVADIDNTYRTKFTMHKNII